MKTFLKVLVAVGVIFGINRMYDRGYIHCNEIGCVFLNPWSEPLESAAPIFPPEPPPPAAYTEEMQSHQFCPQEPDNDSVDIWDHLKKQRYCI